MKVIIGLIVLALLAGVLLLGPEYLKAKGDAIGDGIKRDGDTETDINVLKSREVKMKGGIIDLKGAEIEMTCLRDELQERLDSQRAQMENVKGFARQNLGLLDDEAKRNEAKQTLDQVKERLTELNDLRLRLAQSIEKNTKSLASIESHLVAVKGNQVTEAMAAENLRIERQEFEINQSMIRALETAYGKISSLYSLPEDDTREVKTRIKIKQGKDLARVQMQMDDTLKSKDGKELNKRPYEVSKNDPKVVEDLRAFVGK